MSDDRSIKVIYNGNSEVLKQNVWEQSGLIVEMADGGEGDIDIHHPSTDNEVIDKAIEWMKAMAATGAGDGALRVREIFANNFLEPMEEPDKWPLLFQTVILANYLNIETLLDASCKFVDKMINKISPEEMNKYFNITISTEEEDELIRHYPWLDHRNLIAKDRENINGRMMPDGVEAPSPAAAPEQADE